MRQSLDFHTFVRNAWLPPDDIEEFRAAGLLDPDGDGVFDDYDVYRLQILSIYRGLEYTTDEIVELTRGSDDPTTRRLFGASAKRYTIEQAAAEIGLETSKLEHLMTIVGISGRLLEEDDIEGFRGVRVMHDAGFPWEAVVEGARVYADVLRKLAESEVRLTHSHLCEGMSAQGLEEKEIGIRLFQSIQAIKPIMDRLIEHMHHEYLLMASIDHAFLHLDESSSGIPGSFPATIMFVDLALFTSLTQVQGDAAAVEILDRFDQIIRRELHETGGNLVKQIGDEFMLKFSDEVEAVEFAVDLQSAISKETDFPAVRIAIHSGPVLYKVGDYVGHTVNVASRVAGMAMPNTILITEPVARVARLAGIDVEEIGLRRARGLEDPIALFRVTKGSPQLDRDPVCGRTMHKPVARLHYEGAEYGFDSQDCLKQFLDSPDQYVKAAAS